ncbi:twitching motility protein PilT [Halocatena halophila]|uniref:twitching motility protein PilT n=1 Tax=Halocatena halophila TaxID=2814576 RepID=UPI002ED54C60
MTDWTPPPEPTVLDTAVLSNFAYCNQIQLLGDIAGSCTVPVVRHELQNGVENHPYLTEALDSLDDGIPVATISETVANRQSIVSTHLDPGEAQAFALADVHNGQLLTDDGDARRFSKEQGVRVIGSVGVLLGAIDAGSITEATADEWLSQWIDEIGYYVPYKSISEYR